MNLNERIAGYVEHANQGDPWEDFEVEENGDLVLQPLDKVIAWLFDK